MIELIDAISIRLDEVFDSNYPIYLENVKQGLVTPCFFIQPVYGSDENMISNRKYRTYNFDIIFIPDNIEDKSLFAEVSAKLFNSFDSLEVDGAILPTFERRINVVNNTLHFGVTFKYYLYDVKEPEPEMEDLLITVIRDV